MNEEFSGGSVKHVVFIVLLAIAGFILFSYFKPISAEIYQFSGEVVRADGNNVTLHGVFVGPEGAVPERFSSPRNFSFMADESTSFRKLETFMPSLSSVAASQGTVTESGANVVRYSSRDLVSLDGDGSLDDLLASGERGDVFVEVEFESSIHGTKNPVASHIFYHVLVLPELLNPEIQ